MPDDGKRYRYNFEAIIQAFITDTVEYFLISHQYTNDIYYGMFPIKMSTSVKGFSVVSLLHANEQGN